jgi:flagellar basal body rod protein FlgC
MNDAMSIAASGMAAASISLAASASNIANSGTEAPVAGAGQTSGYQPVTVAETTSSNGGVTATVVPQIPGSVLGYDPSSPFANMQGMVSQPNDNQAQDVANQMSAVIAYKANIASFKAAENTEQMLLNAIA